MTDLEHELDRPTVPHDNDDGEATPVPGFEQERPPFSEASIVDILQAEHKELAEAKDTLIPVKGYERTGLQVQYRLPDRGKELDDIARKVMREMKDAYSRNLYTAIDTMIHLCTGIYVQPPGVEEPVILDPENTGSPALFDVQLAQLMGMENIESSRQVVRRLFGNNDMAIIAHAEKLNRWLQNTKADLSLEIWQQGE